MWRITAFDRDGRRVTGIEIEAGEVTIGRETDRQIMLPSASVSRKHAKVVLNPPTPYVMDEGSANGVLVNGVRIAQPTAIAPGVRVDVAEFYLEFEQSAPGQALPPPSYGAPQQPAFAPPPAANPYGGMPQQQPGGYGAAGPPAGFGQPMAPQYDSGAPMTEAVRPIDDRMSDPNDVVRLCANGGPFDGRIYDIPPGEMGVGRAVDNELVLDDPSLSRKHARIRRAGPGRIELEDLGSSNGTYVNGRKVGRGTAGPGDTVRFGDLIFRVQGNRPEGTRAIGAAPAWQGLVVWGGVGVVLLGAVAVGVYFLVFAKKGPGGGKASLAKMQTEAAEHVKNGKARLADKKFDLAAAEFDQALDLDPSNDDARKLKAQAESEPKNQNLAKQVTTKIATGDRLALESAGRFLASIPDESVFHEPTAKALSDKLVSFGQQQCKIKRYNDCAWAICKAYDVAPDGEKPDADIGQLLTDAEKKLAKDKSYQKCKVKH